MEITTKITLDMLTADSVSIIEQKTVNEGGVEMQVGQNIRTAYMNCTEHRTLLQEKLPTEYYNAILSLWGDTPTVVIEGMESVEE